MPYAITQERHQRFHLQDNIFQVMREYVSDSALFPQIVKIVSCWFSWRVLSALRLVENIGSWGSCRWWFKYPRLVWALTTLNKLLWCILTSILDMASWCILYWSASSDGNSDALASHSLVLFSNNVRTQFYSKVVWQTSFGSFDKLFHFVC